MAEQGERFAGRKALVTGASKGIGRAVAVALAREGADVGINYHSSDADAEQTAAAVREFGRQALLLKGDVSDQAFVGGMVARTASEFGRLDLFVSNAVYSDRELMIDADMQGFRRTIDVTMWGAFHGVRAAAQQMVRQLKGGQGTGGRSDGQGGGAITVVSSPHAVIPIPTAMAYNMAKAAIDHMARTAAIELVRYGIRVNVMHPGWIDTPGERKFFSEEQIQQGGQSLPMGRLGTPEEIAGGILFTLSDAAAYMTGSTLTMDGGVGLPWWSNRAEGQM